jgi:hypothetical protein
MNVYVPAVVGVPLRVQDAAAEANEAGVTLRPGGNEPESKVQ